MKINNYIGRLSLALLLSTEVSTLAYAHSGIPISPNTELTNEAFAPKGQAITSSALQPLVSEMGISEFLKENQATFLTMNDLSYSLAKGDKYIDDFEKVRKQLVKDGWSIHAFGGMEGTFNTYGDLSGFVAYHAEKNLMTVIYHGTASDSDHSKGEGWETNFGGNLIHAHQLEQKYVNDSFDLLLKETISKKKEFEGKFNRKEKMFSFLEEELTNFDSMQGGRSLENLQKFSKTIEQSIEVCSNLLKKTIDTRQKEIMNHYSSVFKSLNDSCHDRLQLIDYVKNVSPTVNDKQQSTIKGQIHEGFLKKYYSSKSMMLDSIKKIVNTLDSQKRLQLRIVFSGHSQAGGTGNLALADVCGNHGKEIFGANFDNTKSNNMIGYFLSGARVGDSKYKDWIHSTVGMNNIIRQNVYGDPVPVISATENSPLSELLKNIPAFGHILGKFGAYDDTGTLLLDNPHDVWNHAKAAYAQDGKDLSQYTDLEDALHYFASWTGKKLPEFLLPAEQSKGFLLSPIQWIKKRYHAYKIAQLMHAAVKGDKEAIHKLSQLLTERFAHFHYGFMNKKGEAVFDPHVVGTNLDAMLQNGKNHQAQKQVK